MHQNHHHHHHHRLKSWDLLFPDSNNDKPPLNHVLLKMHHQNQHPDDQTLANPNPKSSRSRSRSRSSSPSLRRPDPTSLLPDPLLLRVLSLLPPADPSLPLVCRRWLRLHGLLRHRLLLLSLPPPSSFSLPRLLSRFPQPLPSLPPPRLLLLRPQSFPPPPLPRHPLTPPRPPLPHHLLPLLLPRLRRHRLRSRNDLPELPQPPSHLGRQRLWLRPPLPRRTLHLPPGDGAPPLHRPLPPPHLRLLQPPDPQASGVRRRPLLRPRCHRHRPHHPRPRMQAPREARAVWVRG
ncbi:F-box protein-like [Iris pallida]|uniref:F-box protein-like n=1 Tax=Iris pallida TaxID=29817 RepID=A0AAX6HFG4_IRIPA|nr:F-box protein-like [Iris pallida]